MAILNFKYYMHEEDDELELMLNDALEQAGHDFRFTRSTVPGNPFYEITLNCQVDTETGNVKILGIDTDD